MAFLRDNYESLSDEDYKEAEELYKAINSLIAIYSKQQSDLFHLQAFFSMVSYLAKKSYKVDKKIASMTIENVDIKALQQELNYVIKWTVFKSSPKIKIAFILTFAIINSLLIKFTDIKNAGKSINLWYIDLLKSMAKENFSTMLHT